MKLLRTTPLALVLGFALSLCSFAPAGAAPMGFKGSWMAMGDFSPNWREGYINYAFTPRDALGLEMTYMRSDDQRKTRELASLTYTRLLQRWNNPSSQANLWFFGGLGAIDLSEQGGPTSPRRTLVSPGVQFDYETTRVYLALTQRLYRAKDMNHDYSAVRVGFSFYDAEYDQTQPWLIVEARRMQGLTEKTEITPMLRLINKDYFIEAGVNTERQARFNLMVIF